MNKELILEALTVARDAMDLSDVCLPAGSTTEIVVRAARDQVAEALAHIDEMSKMVSPEEAELKDLRLYKSMAAALMNDGSAKIKELMEERGLLIEGAGDACLRADELFRALYGLVAAYEGGSAEDETAALDVAHRALAQDAEKDCD